MAGTIPTKEVVAKRIGGEDMTCGICGAEEESLFHIFKECHGARSLAFESKWGFTLDKWKVSNISEMIMSCVHRMRELKV